MSMTTLGTYSRNSRAVWDRSPLIDTSLPLPSNLTVLLERKRYELTGIAVQIWLALDICNSAIALEQLLKDANNYGSRSDEWLRDLILYTLDNFVENGLLVHLHCAIPADPQAEDIYRFRLRSYAKTRQPHLISVSWNWTNLCNFNCLHCYSRTEKYVSELDSITSKRVAKELKDLGVFIVRFGGGECLLRPDFLSVLKATSDHGMYCELSSNGYIFSTDHAYKLKQAGLGALNISLDGHNAEAHETMRNQAGSFDRALSAIKIATDAGLDVSVLSMITPFSANHSREIISTSLERGAKRIYFKLVKPAGNALNNPAVHPVGSQLVDLLAELAGLRRDYQDFIDVNYGEASDPLLKTLGIGESAENGVDACSCGRSTLCIKPDGSITVCPYSEFAIGDLKKNSLFSIWANSPLLQQFRSSDYLGCHAKDV